jgi:hypothetical protein
MGIANERMKCLSITLFGHVAAVPGVKGKLTSIGAAGTSAALAPVL